MATMPMPKPISPAIARRHRAPARCGQLPLNSPALGRHRGSMFTPRRIPLPPGGPL
jgi:hypothetical protein